MKVSRRRLLVLAIEDFLHLRRNQKCLKQINATAQDQPDPAEQARFVQMKRIQRQALQGEW